MRDPAETSKDQNAKKRIVESPCVMAWDRDEYAARTIFASPDEWSGPAVLNPAGPHADRFFITGQIPIPFVFATKTRETARQRTRIIKIQIERAVSKFGSPAPGEANLTAQNISGIVAVHGEMQIDQSSAILLKLSKVRDLFGGPARIIGIKNDHIRFA